MDNHVQTFEAARKRLLEKLMKNGYVVDFVHLINQSRYMIVIGKPENLLIIYKREPFYNFGKQFKSLGMKGVGDSINIEDLRAALQKDVRKIYLMFPNNHAYSISMENFLLKSIRWTNLEGKDVRSISIHEYKKEFEI